MRIKDIIVEEISITSYERELTAAINNAVKHSLEKVLPALAKLPKKAAADLESDDSDKKLFKEYFALQVATQLDSSLATYIRDSVNKSMGKSIIGDLTFDMTSEGEGGYAIGRDIVLDIRYKQAISRKIVEKLLNSADETYDPGERVKGIAFMTRMASTGDRQYWSMIYYGIDRIIAAMVSTMLHEVVHVMQYDTQDVRGRDDFEYRSYLDKHKGEFRSMVDRASAGEPVSDDERFWDLYIASPQEISAFAHQAALNLIRSFELNNKTDAFADITADDIVRAVDETTSERFKVPKNRKELMVRKRYMKLVYLEVARYVAAHKRKTK